jgi:restriction endonuclease
MKGAQDARQRLRDRIARAREKARAAVKACKVSAKETELAELDRLLQELERERVEIYSLRMKANQLIDERGRRGGRRAAELRAESDDEVRRDLGDDQELEALWEKVKHKIKGSARRSRTEAFLEYVHDHPEDLDELRAQQELQWEREAEELFKTMGEHEAVGKLDQDELEQYGRELDQAERLTGEVPF